MSPITEDLAAHLTRQIEDAVCRTVALARGSVPANEVLMLLTAAGLDVLCTAIASTVATAGDVERADGIVAEMIANIMRSLDAQRPGIVAKATAAINGSVAAR